MVRGTIEHACWQAQEAYDALHAAGAAQEADGGEHSDQMRTAQLRVNRVNIHLIKLLMNTAERDLPDGIHYRLQTDGTTPTSARIMRAGKKALKAINRVTELLVIDKGKCVCDQLRAAMAKAQRLLVTFHELFDQGDESSGQDSQTE
jgi:hypothetical protein